MKTHINRSNSDFIAKTVMEGIAMLCKAQEQREKEKEATTMQVTYNGFTGKLLKMEYVCENYYDITIYDAEKGAKVSFSGVKLEDVKFMVGAVAFGG